MSTPDYWPKLSGELGVLAEALDRRFSALENEVKQHGMLLRSMSEVLIPEVRQHGRLVRAIAHVVVPKKNLSDQTKRVLTLYDLERDVFGRASSTSRTPRQGLLRRVLREMGVRPPEGHRYEWTDLQDYQLLVEDLQNMNLP